MFKHGCKSIMYDHIMILWSKKIKHFPCLRWTSVKILELEPSWDSWRHDVELLKKKQSKLRWSYPLHSFLLKSFLWNSWYAMVSTWRWFYMEFIHLHFDPLLNDPKMRTIVSMQVVAYCVCSYYVSFIWSIFFSILLSLHS